MTIVAVSSLKGGVGKTTAATHIAHALARAGSPTLLVDCDPAGHASVILGGKGELTRGVRRGLDAMSCELSSYSKEMSPADAFGFAQRLQLLQAQYEYVLVDCAPALSPLTRSILGISDCVLVPVDEGGMATVALEELLDFLNQSKLEPLVLVLRSMVNRRAARTSALNLNALSCIMLERAHAGKRGDRTGYLNAATVGVLEASVRRTEIANQLSHQRKTGFDITSANPLAEDYYEVVSELLALLPTRSAGLEHTSI